MSDETESESEREAEGKTEAEMGTETESRTRTETTAADDGDSGATVGHDLDAPRTTAPMSEYTSREVGVGILVSLVGIGIAFGVPLLTT